MADPLESPEHFYRNKIELLGHLRQIPDRDKGGLFMGGKQYTINQLIREIEDETEVGIEYVGMFAAVKVHNQSIARKIKFQTRFAILVLLALYLFANMIFPGTLSPGKNPVFLTVTAGCLILIAGTYFYNRSRIKRLET